MFSKEGSLSDRCIDIYPPPPTTKTTPEEWDFPQLYISEGTRTNPTPHGIHFSVINKQLISKLIVVFLGCISTKC